MNILAWIVLGGFAGWLASIITRSNKRMGMLLNITVGIIGASIGGWIFHTFGSSGVTGFNWHSFWVATIGAVVFLAIFKVIFHK